MSDKLYTPSNPNAQQGVRNVLKYLSDITYEKIITGQHTQTMAQEELHLIEKVTGKQPALLGFELLSYSPTRTPVSSASAPSQGTFSRR